MAFGQPRIEYKTNAQMRTMHEAGLVLSRALDAAVTAAVPGVTTKHLDDVFAAVLNEAGAKSNFLGYHGFPATVCTSVNEVICHGIPDDRRLVDGDIVNLDVTVIDQIEAVADPALGDHLPSALLRHVAEHPLAVHELGHEDHVHAHLLAQQAQHYPITKAIYTLLSTLGNGTALAGDDYTGTSGTLSFQAGETTGPVLVGTTTTSGDGTYLFPDLAAGTYVVRETGLGQQVLDPRGKPERSVLLNLQDLTDIQRRR